MSERPTSIPHGPADITAPWLSSALGTQIADVTVTSIGTGQSGATYRVTPTYTRPTALPATLIAKVASQDAEVRERVVMGYRAEVSFYRDVAPTVDIPVPRCFYVDSDGADFVLLLDDLAPAVQGNQIAGCSAAQARLAVEALAGLHGSRWCDPALLTYDACTMPKPNADMARGLGQLAHTAADTTIGELSDRLGPQDCETVRQAAALVEGWLMLQPDRFSLLHGDYRLDNLMYSPDDRAVVAVDWQTITIGLPARDLAYFLGTSLEPQLRRSHELRLVEAYHRALVGHGVTDYDAESCYRDYRLAMLQASLLTTFGFAFVAATERGDDMVLAMLRRGCCAIRELDTVELTRQLLAG
jgi:aminoglycoside phosphotransferase (APT) family kinase protein